MANSHRAVSIAIVSVTIVLFEIPLRAQLGSSGNQLWHQGIPGVVGALGADSFGGAVAVGDFDGDGFRDLAVGIAGEDPGGIQGAGAVQVFYGTAAGLSSAGNQLWSQASEGVIGSAEEQDFFGRALATGDFDGDGKDDLAIGVPTEDIGTVLNAGAVQILYGTAAGLSSADNQLWHQDTPGISDVAELQDAFGRALAVGDFDHDGWDDLAIGVPAEGFNLDTNAGAVQVLYGSVTGLSTNNEQLWHQSSPGILDVTQTDDVFGQSLAVGDFNLDDFDDLAIGVPFEDHFGVTDAGIVQILYGGPSGLSSAGNQLFSQDDPDIFDVGEESDQWGGVLAAGDFDGDGRDDLAIGIPEEDLIGSGDGGLNVLYGGIGGLSATDSDFFSQLFLLDEAEQLDEFGWALAAGDFNNDGRDDLAVGVHQETVDDVFFAGALQIIYGSNGGLTEIGNQFWTQDSPGILDSAEQGDTFGHAVAAGDFNNDGWGDLAVGVLSEDIDRIANAGAVQVLYGLAPAIFADGFESADTSAWSSTQ